jgi:hypothetical protein
MHSCHPIAGSYCDLNRDVSGEPSFDRGFAQINSFSELHATWNRWKLCQAAIVAPETLNVSPGHSQAVQYSDNEPLTYDRARLCDKDFVSMDAEEPRDGCDRIVALL